MPAAAPSARFAPSRRATNHLDAESVAWLERHLQEYKGTVVAVTHDRYFLDNVAGWILELDRGEGIPWKGNYSSWLEQKELRLANQEKQESARRRTLSRELEWVRMAPRARHAKSKARLDAYEALLAEEGEQRAEALEISKRLGIPRYETIQNEFNLYTRNKFEGPVQDLCVREEISGIHYYGLASGFLSGKYRSEADAGKSPRGKGIVAKYLDARGRRILAALDAVSARPGAALAEVALAWVAAQPAVAAPIASATSVAQVQSLVRGARLRLSDADLKELTDAGR